MTSIAVIMDPLHSLNLKKDTTLAMLRAAQRRGWEISYLEQGDLYYADGCTQARLRPLRLASGFAETLDPAAPEAVAGQWYELGDAYLAPLRTLDMVLIRKDPPFDMEYIYMTYLLERAQQEGVQVVNDPRSIRDCNEKFFATAFPQCQPPLVVSRDAQVLKSFHEQHGDVIFKPLDGMGGASIFRLQPNDPNFSVIVETLTNNGAQQIMGQRFLPEISDGDHRVLLIDGEPVPYALARIPQRGETRGNLAAGGTGEGRPLTDQQRWIAQQVGPEVKARGLRFVGIDVIGDYLTEVNVTCPTCVRELDSAFALDIAGSFLDAIAASP